MISILATSTHYFPKKISIEELALKADKSLEWAKSTGIKEIHVTEKGIATTDVAALVSRKVLHKSNILAENVDQLAFISEGISDYLYMDTSKTVIKKIGGRIDGKIYSYDLQRGSNGTIGFIKLIGNQVLSNPFISTSLISSALIWGNHSNKRFLGETFLGDGAGALILKKDMGYNQVLSTALCSMSEYNMVSGFNYGGTEHDFTKEVVQSGEFFFNILDKNHLQGILNNVVFLAVSIGKSALSKAEMKIDNIDYIGISGFHKRYNDAILSEFGSDFRVINSLATKGYLGSVGVIDILDQFLNNDSIKSGNTMLVIAIGIDINVEAMVIRK